MSLKKKRLEKIAKEVEEESKKKSLLERLFGLFKLFLLYVTINAVILSYSNPPEMQSVRTVMSSNMSFEDFTREADLAAGRIGVLNPNSLEVLENNTYMFPYKSMYENYSIAVRWNQTNRWRGDYVHKGADIGSTVMKAGSTTEGYSSRYDQMIIAPTRMVIKNISQGHGVNSTSLGKEKYIFGMIDDDTVNSGLYYRFFHFVYINPNLKVGDVVEKGTPLGVEGDSGSEGADHLHIEVRSSADKTSLNYNPFTFSQNIDLEKNYNALYSYFKTSEGRADIEQILKDYNETAVKWAVDPSLVMIDTKNNLIEPDKVKTVDDFIKVWEDNRSKVTTTFGLQPFYVYPREDHFVDPGNIVFFVTNGDAPKRMSGSIPNFTRPNLSSYKTEIDWETGKWRNQP